MKGCQGLYRMMNEAEYYLRVEHIKREREALGMTQKYLGSLVGLSETAVDKIENCKGPKDYIEPCLRAMESVLRGSLAAKEVMSPPIYKMNLSPRSYNILHRNGYRVVSDLIGVTEKELKHIKGAGPKSINEIIEKAAIQGVEIRREK